MFSAWHHPYTGKRPGGRRKSATWCCCAGQKQNQYNGGVHLASILCSTDAWSVLLRAVYAMNVYLCCVFLLCLGTSGKGDIQRNFLVSSVFSLLLFLFSFFFLYFCALIGTSGKGDVQVCIQGNFHVSSVLFLFFTCCVFSFWALTLQVRDKMFRCEFRRGNFHVSFLFFLVFLLYCCALALQAKIINTFMILLR